MIQKPQQQITTQAPQHPPGLQKKNESAHMEKTDTHVRIAETIVRMEDRSADARIVVGLPSANMER